MQQMPARDVYLDGLLDPRIKRDAQTKSFLARSPLGALKRFRNFAGAGFLPRE